MIIAGNLMTALCLSFTLSEEETIDGVFGHERDENMRELYAQVPKTSA